MAPSSSSGPTKVVAEEKDQPAGDATMPPGQQGKGKKVSDDVSEGKKVKKNTNYCHRCCSKGHVMVDCTTDITCQICVSNEHVAAKCPLKKSKPMTYLVGAGIDNYHMRLSL